MFVEKILEDLAGLGEIRHALVEVGAAVAGGVEVLGPIVQTIGQIRLCGFRSLLLGGAESCRDEAEGQDQVFDRIGWHEWIALSSAMVFYFSEESFGLWVAKEIFQIPALVQVEMTSITC